MADQEPAEETPEEKPPRSKAWRITYIVLHVLLHVIFIAHFIGATVVFILFGESCACPYGKWSDISKTGLDKESDECIPPRSPAEETTESPGNLTDSTTSAPEESTSQEPKSSFKTNILCKMNWCHGYGFLIIIFVIFYILWLYYWVFKPYVGIKLYNNYLEPAIDKWIEFSRKL